MPNLKEKLDIKSIGKTGWGFNNDNNFWEKVTIINTEIVRLPFIGISGYSEFNNFTVKNDDNEIYKTGLLGFKWNKPDWFNVKIKE